jgi:uracil-DNA glycosylase
MTDSLDHLRRRKKGMMDADSIWESKRSRLQEPKMKPLTDLVVRLREETGEKVPNFDPDDGGVDAEVLFVFQDPGPAVEDSEFISRDNYPFNKRDYAAKNVTENCKRSGLGRERTVSWNTVPWRVDKKDLGREFKRVKKERRLTDLMRIFEGRNLRAVALFGNPAHELEDEVRETRPDLGIFKLLHPARLAMIGKPGNQERFNKDFQQIKDFLNG